MHVPAMQSAVVRCAEAIEWAAGHCRVQAVDVMRDSPWGTTLRLASDTGYAFLKVLPPHQTDAAASLVAISAALEGDVAPLLAADVARGWLLGGDHRGRPIDVAADPRLAFDLLRSYVHVQARSARTLDRLAALPRFSAKSLWRRTRAFLDCRSLARMSSGPARLSDFIGLERAGLLGGAVDAVSGALLQRFACCESAASVIEHADLHPGNVAMMRSGELVFHDWDNALIGPPGLSLSCLVSGTACLYAAPGAVDAFDDEAVDAALDASSVARFYRACVADAGLESRERLRETLPAAVLAGLFLRLVCYAQYPPRNESERALCASDLEQIAAEILGWCNRLAFRERDRAGADRIVELLHAQRCLPELLDVARHAGGDAVLATPAAEHVLVREVAALAQAEMLAREPARVPALIAGSASRRDPAALALEAGVAAGLLAEHGCLAVDALFPPAMLEQCLAHHRAGLACDQRAWPQVGDRRTMRPLRLGGPFNTPALYAQPLLMDLLSVLLGPDFLIGSMTLVESQPGADAQHWHADHPPLFPEAAVAGSLPAHALTVLIPLVDVDEAVGGTELLKGSHRTVEHDLRAGITRGISLGGCLLFDYRLMHRGMANRSLRARPVLSIVYQRDWFRDAVNFRHFPPLQVAFDELGRIPASLSGLFRLADVIR